MEGSDPMLDPQPKRVGGKTCGNCAATTSPQWRTGGLDGRLLCNRCGLYYARHKRHRPLTTDSTPEEGVGRVSNVRRKQLELCLQHAARRQRDAELYYQRLAAAHAHAAARYASGPPFNQALGPHLSAPAFHLHAGHAASTPAPSTAVPRSPGDVEREIQQHLDRAHQLLMQFHAHPDGSPPPAPHDLFSPHPLSLVLQRQMDIQLQHAPSRQTAELEWHRRATTVGPLPPSAYLPYLGDAFGSPFLGWPLPAPQCSPSPENAIKASGSRRTPTPPGRASSWASIHNPMTQRELEATAAQSVAQRHRPLFEAASHRTPGPSPPRRASPRSSPGSPMSSSPPSSPGPPTPSTERNAWAPRGICSPPYSPPTSWLTPDLGADFDFSDCAALPDGLVSYQRGDTLWPCGMDGGSDLGMCDIDMESGAW